jgi:hypothetical protein
MTNRDSLIHPGARPTPPIPWRQFISTTSTRGERGWWIWLLLALLAAVVLLVAASGSGGVTGAR